MRAGGGGDQRDAEARAVNGANAPFVHLRRRRGERPSVHNIMWCRGHGKQPPGAACGRGEAAQGGC